MKGSALVRLRAATAALCAVAATLLVFPPSANAWGTQGHNTVGAIADLRLSATARTEVSRLLSGEPDPTLAGVSTWADEIRATDPDLGKRSAPWHYVNIAENNCVYNPAVNGNDGSNVIEALRTQSATLADRTQPDSVRRQALKFIVHFTGDIHQPMHAGYARDRGGNNIELRYLGKNTNLHAIWDSGLLDTLQLNDAAELERLLSLPAPNLPAVQTNTAPVQWAQYSCRIALTPGVYPDSSTIGDDYTRQFLPIAETQLRLAGERLGQLLNTLLDPTAGTIVTGS
ncbi:S1/P1 nuclease [Nocardia huaxiensis]|uniref:S1/P1 nuclease n=1 Tax=Nocardia huaxiensis TaxID=2755382 RepID=A0A7D6VDT0_9NOCA|nr:S1/P1 nuclease [Nocardia huaxiensis]QLY33034.1 S1/P1 nuclease [Nocardia huaxiensis]